METNPRILHRGRIFTLVQETVELPNGETVEMEIVRHGGAAAVVPVLPDGRVVLLEQFRHAGGGNIIEIPAGRLEPGESPEACARRELEEETGYKAGTLTPIQTILTTPGFADETIHLFLARDLVAGKPRLEFDECIVQRVVAFPEALNAIVAGDIRDGKTIAGLFAAAVHLGIVRWEGDTGPGRP